MIPLSNHFEEQILSFLWAYWDKCMTHLFDFFSNNPAHFHFLFYIYAHQFLSLTVVDCHTHYLIRLSLYDWELLIIWGYFQRSELFEDKDFLLFHASLNPYLYFSLNFLFCLSGLGCHTFSLSPRIYDSFPQASNLNDMHWNIHYFYVYQMTTMQQCSKNYSFS